MVLVRNRLSRRDSRTADVARAPAAIRLNFRVYVESVGIARGFAHFYRGRIVIDPVVVSIWRQIVPVVTRVGTLGDAARVRLMVAVAPPVRVHREGERRSPCRPITVISRFRIELVAAAVRAYLRYFSRGFVIVAVFEYGAAFVHANAVVVGTVGANSRPFLLRKRRIKVILVALICTNHTLVCRIPLVFVNARVSGVVTPRVVFGRPDCYRLTVGAERNRRPAQVARRFAGEIRSQLRPPAHAVAIHACVPSVVSPRIVVW